MIVLLQNLMHWKYFEIYKIEMNLEMIIFEVEKLRYLGVTVQIQMIFAKRLNAEQTREMHIIIHLRKFYRPVCFQNN